MKFRLIGFFLPLLSGLLSVSAAELDFELNSSFDQSRQQAAGYAPDQIQKDEKLPLLAIAHPMWGDRFAARRLGYYEEGEKRRWLIVCPQLHGRNTPGQFSCSALEAQHDMIDAINWMKAHYPVDESRIYVAGRSMGGGLTQMMLAKYPDLFAAGVAGQGISDYTELRSLHTGVAAKVQEELGPRPANEFEYRRRSATSYAPNFRYVPLILWHGTNDHVVPPEQSLMLEQAIRRYYPQQEGVHWKMAASHHEMNFDAAWICDQLAPYENIGAAFMKTPRRFFPSLHLITDEAKSFFYFHLTPAGENVLGEIQADLEGDVLTVRADNLSLVQIDCDKLSPQLPVRTIRFSSRAPEDAELVIRRGKEELLRRRAPTEIELSGLSGQRNGEKH